MIREGGHAFLRIVIGNSTCILREDHWKQLKEDSTEVMTQNSFISNSQCLAVSLEFYLMEFETMLGEVTERSNAFTINRMNLWWS